MKTDRIRYIDALKGFAILMVVVGHVMDGYINAGKLGSYTNVSIEIHNLIFLFHMPLFFVISGITFRIAYVDGDIKNVICYKKSVLTQLKNIIFVYAVWSVVLWGFKLIFSSGVNNKIETQDIFWIPIKAIPSFWYLYILFFCYIMREFQVLCKQKKLI